MMLVQYQLFLLPIAFVAGCGVTFLCLCKPPEHRIWMVADLLWVVFGLFGALGAVVAELYTADSSRFARQLDLALIETANFERESGHFRLHHCDRPLSAALVALCNEADLLTSSVATNAALPLFIAATGEAAPPDSPDAVSAPLETTGRTAIPVRAGARDAGTQPAFRPLRETTRPALKALQKSDPATAGEFRILARSYAALAARIGRLQQERAILDSRAWLMTVQILAIALVSFAAPFRLGRAISDLRGRGRCRAVQLD